MNRWHTFSLSGKKEIRRLPAVLRERTHGRSELMTKLVVIAAVLALGAALFCVCVYGILPALISQIGDQMQINLADKLYQSTVEQAAEAAPQAEAAVFEQPHEPAAPSVRDCFATVLGENPDIVGRISIEGLGIQYLVTQCGDNSYYLSHGYDNSRSRSGAIFMDYRCDADACPPAGHYVLYGHNMKNGSMFHKLKQYTDRQVFDSVRTIRFDTLYEDYEWEVFSAYVTGTDFNYIETSFSDGGEWLAFLRQLQEKSLYQTDVTLSADDVVLTLSTCSYEFDDARFVVHARLIR